MLESSEQHVNATESEYEEICIQIDNLENSKETIKSDELG